MRLRSRTRFVTKITQLALPLLAICALHAQQVGNNVNMVTGTQWPGGDPFLQRQNEPSMTISSRNPLHMVAGDNDYRTVDLATISNQAEPTGDAWLGFFTSFDGGQTWTSTLVPGYPQDTSLAGVFSPIHGLGAGADPTVRAGTNGMIYYSGLAFNRQEGGASKIFVATYTDDNNLEGGNSIRYLWTTAVDTGTSNLFEDKPSMAVDIPRSWSGACIVPALPLQDTQIFRAGTINVAWTQFTGNEDNGVAAIWYSHSIDCGLTWTTPQQISGTAKTNQGAALAIDPNTGALYITWRVFATTSPVQADSIWYVASFDGGTTFTKPALVANISAFDQGDTDVSFRTNDYPTIAVDSSSRVYIAWAQRGADMYQDARIEVATGIPTSTPKTTPLKWGNPILIDPVSNAYGHQVMPAMEFSAGKLTVAWYDFRDDDLIEVYSPQGTAGFFGIGTENDCTASGESDCAETPSFGQYIQDPAPGTTPPVFGDYLAGTWRQTVEVRAAQATPGNPPSFFPSVQVTSYPYGSVPNSSGSITPTSPVEQLEVDPPNLPMFQSGTLPFFGDYIDVAGPTFIPESNGTWRFNNLSTDPDFTHVVWTDNRDVVPPPDGDWATFTPPTYGTSTTSIFDSTQTRPACSTSTTGYTGDRNQNIYTAQLSPGLGLSAPGDAKPLGTGSNGKLIQRQFPIIVSNTSTTANTYTLTINSQPTGGVASFLQSAVAGQPYPLTSITVQVPPLSNTSRSVFMTSTVANASVTVTATSTSPAQTATVTINPDPNNPPSADTNISSEENYTPTIATPNIANPNIANPNIANPNIANPNIANPNIANPNIANPNIANPNIANPNIANPNIANPNIANTALFDGTITDGTWAVTNTGNTSSAYAVNVIGNTPPAGVTLQLIIYQNYTTPLAQGCNLGTQSHFVPVANITNVTFTQLANLLNPAATNPTLPALALQPGQTAYITLRVYDANTNNPAQAMNDYNPITQASPIVASQGVNTGATQPSVTLTIVTKSLPQATVTGAYSQTLQATGGSGAYTWTLASGTPPTGITLSSAGVLSGTPTGTPGTSSFTVQVKDAAGDIAQQALSIVVNAAPSITPATLSAGDQGVAYPTQTLTETGGTAPLTWSISSNSLPTGLTLTGSGSTATVGGTLGASAATSTFTVKVVDANNVATTLGFTITVNSPPSITTTSLMTIAIVGTAYTPMLVASGGTAPLIFTSQVIDGLTLTSMGTFTGTPTSPGNFPFTAMVTDAIGATASQLLTLVVETPLVLSGTSLPPATIGFPYQFQLTATGGSPPYTWTVMNGQGQLAAGLTLSSTGVISGTPTAAGSSSITVSVEDSNGVTTTQTYATPSGFALVGDATVNGSGVQLTSAGGQTSAAWAGTPQSVASGFSVTFQFQITPASTGPNAIGDGFAFVIQGAPSGNMTLGTTGLGMYIGYAGIPNSLAIEFDTYDNSQYEDPSSPHIGIQSLGTQPNTPDHTPATGANLGGPTTATFADGGMHTATITYDGTSTINVYLDGSNTPVVSSTVAIDLNTLLGLNGGPAYVGFTAATGAAQEASYILSWTWN